MSKRGPGANFGGDEERFGGPGPGNDIMEKPMKATDAQMARRKIAAAKKPRPGASRGASPFTTAPPGSNAPQSFTMTNGSGSSTSNGSAFAFGSTTQPASFNFGASQASQPNPFTSFGQTQPAPANTGTGFGQTQTAPVNTPSFTGFGQSQPQTTSSSNPFGQPQPATGNQAPFSGFGQSQAPPTSTSPFTAFGQTQTAPASTPSFTGFGQSQPQMISSNPFGQSQLAAVNQAPFSGFGQSKPEPTNSSLFPGWTPPDSSRANTPAAAPSQAQPEPAKPSLFGNLNQSKPESEKSSTLFAGIGQQAQQNGTSNLSAGFNQLQAEPANANPFASVTQSQSEPTTANNPFQSFGQTQSEGSRASTPFASRQAEPEKSTGLFAGLGQQPLQQNGASTLPNFGQQVADPEKPSNPFASFGQLATEPAKSVSFTGFGQPQSESTRANTPFAAKQPEPEKAKDLFPGFGQKPQQNGIMQISKPNGEKTGLFGASITTPTTQASGGSIFDTIPKKAPSNFVFSSSDPNQVYRAEEEEEEDDEDELASSNKNSGAEAASLDTHKPAPPRSLFDRIDKVQDNQDASATPKAAPPKSFFSSASKPDGSEAVSEIPKAAPSKSLFDHMNKDDGKKQTSSLFQSTIAPDTPKAALATGALTAPAQQSPTAYSHPPLSDLKKAAALKNLNEGVIAHLKNQDPSTDLSMIFLFAAAASAEIMGTASPWIESAAALKWAAPPSGKGGSNMFSAAAPQLPPWTNGSSAPTPASMSSQIAMPSSGSTLNANTATPKLAGQNLFSKPPSTAPPAKKRMLEVDDESSVQPATEKRAKASYPDLSATASKTTRLFASTLEKQGSINNAQPSGFTGFKPSTSTPGFTPSASTSSGFKPSASTSSPTKTTSSQAPTGVNSAGGFTLPTFAAASTGGGSFLSSFGANAKKNEEAERKKRMDEDYDSDDGTKEEWENRDREEQEKKRQKILDAAKAAKGFKVSTLGDSAPIEVASSAPTAAERSQGTGDNTWSKASPIKFGTATATDTPSATPAITKPLFGSLDPTTPAAPTPSGSLFGATPAIPATVGGSDKEEDDSAEDTSARQDDFAGLLPAELKDNSVLKELQDTKTSKFEETDQVGDDGKKTRKWVSKASGRLFVLKNNDNGKIRILCKAPQGQVLLNYNPVKGTKYTIAGKKELMVSCAFMDHIYDNPAKMGRFIITTASVDDAKDLARYLTEGAS